MKRNSDRSKSKKGKQFTVIRNFNGTLSAQEYIEKLVKEYIDKEHHKS